MSDDPTAASSAARSPAHDDNNNDNDSDVDIDTHADVGTGEGPSQPRSQARRRSQHGRRRSLSRVRRAKAGIQKKLAFMAHFMSSLDMLVFAELCVLYYMDCSFARLAMRSIVQYMYLTPKPEDFLKLMPAPRPQIYTIFGSNIMCMLFHLIFALPEANETARGYLHGGVIIDFIGQKAPTSKVGLLLLDCLVLLLQCIMCAVWLEKDRLKKLEITLRSIAAGGFPKGIVPVPGTAATTTDATIADVTPGQDLDAEERGVLRDDPLGADETNDIEMQPLMNERSSPSNDGGIGHLEARYQRMLRSSGGSSNEEEGADRPSLLDVLMSGNGLLANLNVVRSVRTLGAEGASVANTAGYPLRLTGYTTTLAAIAAESQARLERRTRQRS
ncbi:DSC E3 ubiquitin ligase complex subunit 4 [Cytospora mali]|uniref:DSC E3 ubiquitin ligase complex subunit 4 n=1 Tax=Cytospora mali TaxID=578113 RepID=A0A194VS95_CYTMA|nr:DSC E3 ubiquitin ligase complex subunit 4 [Valsa mali]